MAQTTPIIKIQNVVASINVNQEINLIKITKKFPNAEYDTNRVNRKFPALVFRTKDPKTATLIFSSGKMINTGAKSKEFSRIAIKLVIDDLISKKIITRKKIDFKIQNMVASVNLGGIIHLEKVAHILPKCLYEPEQFPAVIYKVPDPKSTHLIFSSGKTVCTGAKNIEDLTRSINNLHSDLEKEKLIVYA